MIEEVGMSGRFSLTAQVLQSTRQTVTEEQLPDSIDERAGGQGVILRDHPSGKIHAVRLSFSGLQFSKKLRNRGLHLFPRLIQPISSRKDSHRTGISTFGDQHASKDLTVIFDIFVGLLDLGFQLREFGFVDKNSFPERECVIGDTPIPVLQKVRFQKFGVLQRSILGRFF